MTKLLPCPFCGKQPRSEWFSGGESDDCGYWDIGCCGAFAHEDDEETAIKLWNTRTPARPDGEVVAWRPSSAASIHIPSPPPPSNETRAAEIERLHERCDAYKGQVKCGSEEISRLRLQLADAEATLFKLNSGEELQSLMKLNNELRSQLADAQTAIRSALVIAEAEWIFKGAHPHRQVALEQMRSALSDEQKP